MDVGIDERRKNEIVIFYIFVIAVLNLGVGFALAAYIGRQYRDMISADDPWDFDQTLEPETPETEMPEVETPETEALKTETPEAETPEAETPEAETSEAETSEAETSEAETPETEASEAEALKTETPEAEASEAEALKTETPETLAGSTASEPSGDTTAETSTDTELPSDDSPDADASIDEALEDRPDESPAEALGLAENDTQAEEEAKDGGDSPDDEPIEDHAAESEVGSEPEKTAGEACVETFRSEVAQYREELKQVDSDLRGDTEPLEPVAIEQALSSLSEATEEYITKRDQKRDRFEELYRSNPKFDGIRERLQTVTQRQDEQIASVHSAADSLDYEGELEEGCRRVLRETNKLLDVNDQVRDELDEAMLQVARSENRLDDLDPAARFDPLTETLTRVGLESVLTDLWKKDPQRSRKVCGVLIDLDQFGRINEQHGRALGDRTLATVAQTIRAEDLGKESVLARVAGQQFFLLLPDSDTRAATTVAERVRQIIDVSRFEYRDQDIAVSVSCGVAMAEADDTPASLLEKVRTTLQEAKRYGRNRTFLYEGQYPTPVVPPNLSLTEKQITL